MLQESAVNAYISAAQLAVCIFRLNLFTRSVFLSVLEAILKDFDGFVFVHIVDMMFFELLQVIYEKVTGRSRGFGFVTMSTVEEVEAAAQQFNGYVCSLFSLSYA